jgi:thiamine-monophosphate kinase
MRVSEIGEFGLIKLLAKELGLEYPPSKGKPPEGLLVGLGDDAVVSARREGALVWTTDTMVANLHFLEGQSAWPDVGWKALTVNVSDIAAMGATPHLALITLMLPQDFCVEDVVALYGGLKQAADEFGVTVGGGDIVGSPVFAITAALSGWALMPKLGQPRVMTRSAARPGDVVAVSGTPGESAAGLHLMRDDASSFETEAEQRLRQVYERPQPRLALGRAALRLGVRCAIDVSDGLVQDAGHIATASGVGIRIDAARLPVSDALRQVYPAEATRLVLTGGGDYELILAGPKPVLDLLAARSDVPLTQIGEVVAAETPGVTVIDVDGKELVVGSGGWDHFRGA